MASFETPHTKMFFFLYAFSFFSTSPPLLLQGLWFMAIPYCLIWKGYWLYLPSPPNPIQCYAMNSLTHLWSIQLPHCCNFHPIHANVDRGHGFYLKLWIPRYNKLKTTMGREQNKMEKEREEKLKFKTKFFNIFTGLFFSSFYLKQYTLFDHKERILQRHDQFYMFSFEIRWICLKIFSVSIVLKILQDFLFLMDDFPFTVILFSLFGWCICMFVTE